MYMFLPISCGFYHKESFSCTEFDLVKAWLKTTKKNNEAYFNLVSRYFLSSLNEPWFFASKSLSIFLSRNPLNIHVPILGLQSKPSQDPISLMKRIFEPTFFLFLPESGTQLCSVWNGVEMWYTSYTNNGGFVLWRSWAKNWKSSSRQDLQIFLPTRR